MVRTAIIISGILLIPVASRAQADARATAFAQVRAGNSLRLATLLPGVRNLGGSASTTHARNYALPGAIIGAVVIGGGSAAVVAALCDGDSGTNCSSDTITSGLIGAAAGAVIGGIIGSFIHKNPAP